MVSASTGLVKGSLRRFAPCTSPSPAGDGAYGPVNKTASTRHRGHPITVAAAEVHEVLDALTEVSTWSMEVEQTRATLRELTAPKHGWPS